MTQYFKKYSIYDFIIMV